MRMTGDRDNAMAAGCDDYDTNPSSCRGCWEKIEALLAVPHGGLKCVRAGVGERSPRPSSDRRRRLVRQSRRTGLADHVLSIY